MEEKTSERQNPYLIPLSIIAAGAIIAGAVLYSRGVHPEPLSSAKTAGVKESLPSSNVTIRPITNSDHILGNPNAPVKIVEYSDTECPFCKAYHPTLQQVMAQYGKSGQVAWIYRHFPLDQLHPKARKEAEATECANELGGGNAFWAYLNKVFEVTPSNNGLDPAELPNIADGLGLDHAKFVDCLTSGKYAAKVDADYQDAVRAGGNGTPFTVFVPAKGNQFTITGAQPIIAVRQAVEQALASQ